jgi:mannitol-specific phosphotransferase system IIBC component
LSLRGPKFLKEQTSEFKECQNVEKKSGSSRLKKYQSARKSKKDISRSIKQQESVKKVYSIVWAFYYGMGMNGMGINITTKKKEKQRENMLNIAGKGVY